jgi:hypothetical protein
MLEHLQSNPASLAVNQYELFGILQEARRGLMRLFGGLDSVKSQLIEHYDQNKENFEKERRAAKGPMQFHVESSDIIQRLEAEIRTLRTEVTIQLEAMWHAGEGGSVFSVEIVAKEYAKATTSYVEAKVEYKIATMKYGYDTTEYEQATTEGKRESESVQSAAERYESATKKFEEALLRCSKMLTFISERLNKPASRGHDNPAFIWINKKHLSPDFLDHHGIPWKQDWVGYEFSIAAKAHERNALTMVQNNDEYILIQQELEDDVLDILIDEIARGDLFRTRSGSQETRPEYNQRRSVVIIR